MLKEIPVGEETKNILFFKLELRRLKRTFNGDDENTDHDDDFSYGSDYIDHKNNDDDRIHCGNYVADNQSEVFEMMVMMI